jgi:hypothetical protein
MLDRPDACARSKKDRSRTSWLTPAASGTTRTARREEAGGHARGNRSDRAIRPLAGRRPSSRQPRGGVAGLAPPRACLLDDIEHGFDRVEVCGGPAPPGHGRGPEMSISSWASTSTAPTRRSSASGLGKMPRLLCLLSGVGDLHGRRVVALQQLVELAGDDALEARIDLAGVLALGGAPLGIGARQGSSRRWTTAMVCRALLSCRSLRRLSGSGSLAPEDAGNQAETRQKPGSFWHRLGLQFGPSLGRACPRVRSRT